VGEKKNRCLAICLNRPEFRAQVHPVDPRHFEGQQEHVDLPFYSERERLLCGLGLDNVVAVRLQHLPQCIPCVRIVIGDKDGAFHSQLHRGQTPRPEVQGTRGQTPCPQNGCLVYFWALLRKAGISKSGWGRGILCPRPTDAAAAVAAVAASGRLSKPVAMTVILTAPFILSSSTAPKMMLASSSAAS